MLFLLKEVLICPLKKKVKQNQEQVLENWSNLLCILDAWLRRSF